MAQPLTAQGGRKPITVSFPSGGSYVVGHLYLPEGHDPARRYPAVAVGGSFTSVKEQMGGIYGGEMARRGVMALAIDYRNYGQSGGATRQVEDQASKVEDLSAALRFLSARPDVSRAGILGICTSGGTALYAAAADKQVGAVATVAGFFSDAGTNQLIFKGAEGIERRRAEGRAARKRFEETGIIDFVTAYDPNDPSAVSTSPSQYYMDPARGGGVRAWRNEFAVMGWEKWLDFDPVAQAPRVTAPTLVVHSDGAAFPGQARKIFESLAGPKQVHWSVGTHFDYYDQPVQVLEASDQVAAHFRSHLA